MNEGRHSKTETSDAARLGLYHCLRQLTTEAAVLDLPDAMLSIARAASLVRLALHHDPVGPEIQDGTPAES